MNVGGFTEKILYQIASGRLLMTAATFLLGLLAGKKEIFRKDSLVFSVGAIVGTLGIAMLNTAILGVINLSYAEHGPNGKFFISLSDVIRQIQRFTLAFFYFTSIVQLYNISVKNKSSLQKVFSLFTPVGKMGLTSYLMQSVFVTLVLSMGIEFLITAGMAGLHLMSIAFFALQILFAHIGPFSPWLQLWPNNLKAGHQRQATAKCSKF